MKTSAGLLVYRQKNDDVEVLLVHPGGPFWAKKDNGAWHMPKGEYDETEGPLAAAKREFSEETGFQPPDGEYIDLNEAPYQSAFYPKAKGQKTIKAWAVKGDFDASKIKSNTILIDWPPKSGRKLEIPEVDRAEWFSLAKAQIKLHKNQTVFIERLAKRLGLKIDRPTGLGQSSLF